MNPKNYSADIQNPPIQVRKYRTRITGGLCAPAVEQRMLPTHNNTKGLA